MTLKVGAMIVDAIAFPLGDRFQIGAGAKLPAIAGEDRDAQILVGVERREGRGERVGAVAVDGVPPSRAVDGDGENRAIDFGEDGD